MICDCLTLSYLTTPHVVVTKVQAHTLIFFFKLHDNCRIVTEAQGSGIKELKRLKCSGPRRGSWPCGDYTKVSELLMCVWVGGGTDRRTNVSAT